MRADTPIAVTGASGQVGVRVARRLAERGVRQRLVLRHPDRAPELPGAEAVAGSYADGRQLRSALDGVSTLFLVSGREAEHRTSQHATAVDAAAAAGVERIVYLSFVGAAPDATFTFARDHWHTEEHIRASGLRFTFLRDNLYLAQLPALVGPDRVLRGPGGDGRIAAVAHDDIAAVVAAVLLADGTQVYDGHTYDLTGPHALSLAEVCRELSIVSGHTVSYEQETVAEAYASRSRFGAPDWEVAGWVSSYEAIAAGDLARVTSAVQDLGGRPPSGLREMLAAYPATYRHLLGPR